MTFNDLEQAVEYHNKHPTIAKELGDRNGEGLAYGDLGNTYKALCKFQQAIEYYKKDLSITKEVANRRREGRVNGNLGNAYGSVGDFQQAIEYHKKHLSIAKEVRDRAQEGCAYANLGNAYRALGDFQQAMQYHKKYLSISQELGDKAREGRAYGNLGTLYQALGDFQQAIEYHKKDLSIAKELGAQATERTAYNNLGVACRALGDFQQAIEYHKKALSIAKEVGDKVGEGGSYGNLGNAYESLADFRQAIEYHKEHLRITKDVGDRAGEGSAYGNLGNAYYSLGDFQQAIEYYKKHLKNAKGVGDKAGEGRASGNLGNAYNEIGDLEQSIEYHKQQLSICKEIGDRATEGGCYGNLGSAYRVLGDLQQAIECHKKGISIAKEVGNRAGEGVAYHNLANAYLELGDFQQAIEYHKKDLSIAKEVGNIAGEASSSCSLGLDFESLGCLPEALDYYRSSVKLYDITRARLLSEDAWKISFREVYRASYTALWRTLLSLQKVEEALFAAEQGRAQALMDALRAQYGFPIYPSASLEPEETISYFVRELSTQTVFLALGGRQNAINIWLLRNGNEIEFRKREIEGRSAHEDAVTLLLDNALKEIGAGVGVRCENRSLDELNDDQPSEIESHERNAESSNLAISPLQPLHDAVIGPIADLLQGDELVIVPDGPLCLAPWVALSKSIRIRTVPSLTSLKLIANCPEDYHYKSGALLVGDPCLQKVTKKRGKPMYSQLPCAKKEVEMIGEILNIPTLTGTEATKKEVLERITAVALVHIAAHGRKETGEIALSPNPGYKSKIPKEEDYILKISDVQAVELRARLVVLSCCHSGRGEVKSEGVVGIARAFLAAGARSVLVSLWAISDEATMEFMKCFYQHLKEGKSASVALHESMKSLRESQKYCAAKYWAPFILIGDDVTLEFGEKQ